MFTAADVRGEPIEFVAYQCESFFLPGQLSVIHQGNFSCNLLVCLAAGFQKRRDVFKSAVNVVKRCIATTHDDFFLSEYRP